VLIEAGKQALNGGFKAESLITRNQHETKVGLGDFFSP
jgi:hypothetical protein